VQGGTKLRENSLRVTHKYIMKLTELLCSNCAVDVPEYAKFPILDFYWIGNHMESNVRVCVALK